MLFNLPSERHYTLLMQTPLIPSGTEILKSACDVTSLSAHTALQSGLNRHRFIAIKAGGVMTGCASIDTEQAKNLAEEHATVD